MPDIGKKIPRLKGVVDDGTNVALADLRGQPLVVYFYPKDNTPGCTNEATAFRDLYPRFRTHGCNILGVSRDDVASHARFRAKYALPFPLVADTDSSWCDAFDVIAQKSLYGRSFIGIVRSTFLVDADGALVEAWRKVRVPGHAEAVLRRLADS